MAKRYYAAQIEQDEDGFGAWFEDFPGCVSAGDTLDEVIQGAHDALALHIAGMIEDGEPIPAGRIPKQADGAIAMVMVSARLPSKRKRVNVNLPEDVLAAIDAVSGNRSAFLEKAARKSLADA